MKDGNIILEVFDLIMSIKGVIPRLSVNLKNKILSGRYRIYIIPPIKIRKSAIIQFFLYIQKKIMSFVIVLHEFDEI